MVINGEEEIELTLHCVVGKVLWKKLALEKVKRLTIRDKSRDEIRAGI